MDVREEFDTFLAVDEDKKASTHYEMMRALNRMLRNGFDAERFSASIEDARLVGRAWLRKRRSEVGAGGYNKDQKVLNALARMNGWSELHFKRQKESGANPRPIDVTRLRAVFAVPRRPHQRRETYLRSRAMLQFALACPVRRVEIWQVRESDLDRVASTIALDDPAKDGKKRDMVMPRELWDPFKPFELWMKWRPIVKNDPEAIWTTTQGWKHGGEPHVLALNSILRSMKELGREAGLDLNFIRTRSSGLTAVRRAGGSMDTVQYHAGHNDQRSTRRYVNPEKELYEQEVRRLRLPEFVPKTRK